MFSGNREGYSMRSKDRNPGLGVRNQGPILYFGLNLLQDLGRIAPFLFGPFSSLFCVKKIKHACFQVLVPKRRKDSILRNISEASTMEINAKRD